MIQKKLSNLKHEKTKGRKIQKTKTVRKDLTCITGGQEKADGGMRKISVQRQQLEVLQTEASHNIIKNTTNPKQDITEKQLECKGKIPKPTRKMTCSLQKCNNDTAR